MPPASTPLTLRMPVNIGLIRALFRLLALADAWLKLALKIRQAPKAAAQ